ncbi:MAG: ABC transporter ATP-binding protein [Burkholderiales bacterium]|nr:MAG: ABC transporter ATP-binding protein [Burkholderiales bacterium]
MREPAAPELSPPSGGVAAASVDAPLVAAIGLSKRFPLGSGRRAPVLHAVDAVDLALRRGESVGLVGESGCGKSTLSRLLARLLDPSDGTITFEGRDIGTIPARAFATSGTRGKIQLVFQDATDSLDPRQTARQAIAEPLLRLGIAGDVDERVRRVADEVGLPPELLGRWPHQLSGGQRARVGIARALAPEPSLLILDEPTAALDVSVQAVVLQLLARLRRERGLTYLFVSHDLNVVRLLCDRVVVMYLGRVVEEGPAAQVFDAPGHPYTRALVSAIPGSGRAPVPLPGEVRSPIDPDPAACRFHGRCPDGDAACAKAMPRLRPVPGSVPLHRVACLKMPG